MTVKSRLLEILEKEKGETLSGEKLAEELHCTRAAIWKAVKSLREEGYMIEAGPNKGYMLVKANDRLSVEAIRPFLSFPEVYIKVYQEVDSTNRAAKAAAVNGEAGHGSFVLAGCQTEGRGRLHISDAQKLKELLNSNLAVYGGTQKRKSATKAIKDGKIVLTLPPYSSVYYLAE